MTTLQINDIEAETILSKYPTSDIVEFIKTFKPKARVKIKENDLDTRLRALKVINPNSGEKLKEALDFLSEEFKKSGYVNCEQAREEYLTDKYSI